MRNGDTAARVETWRSSARNGPDATDPMASLFMALMKDPLVREIHKSAWKPLKPTV